MAVPTVLRPAQQGRKQYPCMQPQPLRAPRRDRAPTTHRLVPPVTAWMAAAHSVSIPAFETRETVGAFDVILDPPRSSGSSCAVRASGTLDAGHSPSVLSSHFKLSQRSRPTQAWAGAPTTRGRQPMGLARRRDDVGPLQGNQRASDTSPGPPPALPPTHYQPVKCAISWRAFRISCSRFWHSRRRVAVASSSASSRRRSSSSLPCTSLISLSRSRSCEGGAARPRRDKLRAGRCVRSRTQRRPVEPRHLGFDDLVMHDGLGDGGRQLVGHYLQVHRHALGNRPQLPLAGIQVGRRLRRQHVAVCGLTGGASRSWQRQ